MPFMTPFVPPREVTGDRRPASFGPVELLGRVASCDLPARSLGGGNCVRGRGDGCHLREGTDVIVSILGRQGPSASLPFVGERQHPRPLVCLGRWAWVRAWQA
eukprot:COSAG02_NODE_1092_length_14622_cov_95.061971_3_plen_103_part_00